MPVNSVLPYPQAATRLELKNEPVPRLLAPVDDLVDHFPTDDLPLSHARSAKRLREEQVAAGIDAILCAILQTVIIVPQQ